MSQYFSPKDVAKAIGVSESSLKRWVDKGLIKASKTAGGHRRLQLDAVLEYLRKTSRSLENPTVLQLPEGCGGRDVTVEDSRQSFLTMLRDGDESAATRAILDAYLSNVSLSEICDLIIAPVFHEIGDLWECGQAEVYEERRACEICLRVVHELRRAVGAGHRNGPIAMGGTLDGDPYLLATSLIELVLSNNGWAATSLGNMLPFETIRTAILTERPALFWVSVTAIRDIDRFVTDFNMLFDLAESQGTALTVGGQALSAEVRQRLRYTNFSDNFQQLESFCRKLKSMVHRPVFENKDAATGQAT